MDLARGQPDQHANKNVADADEVSIGLVRVQQIIQAAVDAEKSKEKQRGFQERETDAKKMFLTVHDPISAERIVLLHRPLSRRRKPLTKPAKYPVNRINQK